MAVIVLVDDDQNILTSVSMALEAEGHKVTAFEEGASALTSINEQPPDLVISDIKMPTMDGMELLRRIRQNSTLPLIFLTSKDEEIDEVLGLTMGADDYVKKTVLAAFIAGAGKDRFTPCSGTGGTHTGRRKEDHAPWRLDARSDAPCV